MVLSKSKIHIVHIVQSCSGGIRKHILDIVSKSPYSDFTFTIISNQKESDKVFQEFLKEIPNNLTTINLPIIKRPCFSDISNIIKIAKHLKYNPAQIIHGHGAKGGLYSRILKPLTGSKSIYSPHGGSIHMMFSRPMNFIYTIVEKVLYSFTDLVIFESKYTENNYKKHIKDGSIRGVLNYNGIELPDNFNSLSPKEITKEKIQACSLGLFRKIKGHAYLIEATAKLRSEGYNITTDIYGEGEERENLQKQIKELNLSEFVKLRPFTSNINSELKKYNLLVHPSLFESFGYVPIEATCNSLSVVCTDVGGLREVTNNGEGAFITMDTNSESLISAIKVCVNKRELRTIKYNNFKKHIQANFEINTQIQKTSMIYKELINSKNV